MNSLLHVFWTGPSFPYSLRAFIKSWVEFLRKSHSDFQLVVWLTNDSYSALCEYMAGGRLGNFLDQKAWGKHLPNSDLLLNPAKLNAMTFYVGMFEPILAHYHPSLGDTFNLLKANRRMTSASNIARLMIVDQCGGIYTDIDYLHPNPAREFPKDIDQLIIALGDTNSNGFYMCISDLGDMRLVENQCVVLDPARKGSLKELFDRMDMLVTKGYADKLKTEVESESQYLDNPVTKGLNRSMFVEGLELELLQAFKSRSFEAFNSVNNIIYRDQYRMGEFVLLTKKGKVLKDPPMLFEGRRHDDYDITGLLTYAVPLVFFERHMSITRDMFYLSNWKRFMAFFDTARIDSQFEFRNLIGNKQGMYSWSNPGYSRLTKLESTVKTVERKYTESGRVCPKELLLSFILEFGGVMPGRLEARISVEERKERYEQLVRFIMDIKNNYVLKAKATEIVKNILRIALIREGFGVTTNMGKFALELLNRSNYKRLKNIIDPETRELKYQDLRDFAEI